MKKILVPCDFSETAMHAVKFAIELARSANGAVHLLHVIEYPPLYESFLMPLTNAEARLLYEFHHYGMDQFRKVTTDPAVADVAISVEVQPGAVYPVILETISKREVDLVVMGSHGARGLRELLIGSNAEQIVRRSPVPVLVVKRNVDHAIKHIVFPNTLDTEHQEELVDEVKALQALFGAQLHIVWINTPVKFTSDKVTHERLDTFARTYGLTNYTTHVFNHSQEEEGIQSFTRLINGDLIALGTHKRRGVAHFANGSLAEDLVNHSDRPVWTCGFGEIVHA
jgi:nucleotide-binding universal stress UspA family protein